MATRAVIFDFDGVVADTMKDNFRAWEKALLFYGTHIQPIEYYLLEGMGRFEIARFFIDKYQLDPAIENDLVEAKEKIYAEDNKFIIYPEIFLIFDLLEAKKIRFAIVTGASRRRIEQSLGDTILKRLSALVTSDDVKNGKPDPEPYLEAVRKLGVPAEQCLVVENADLGVQSAKAAGCTCFAIETTLDKNYLTRADEVFADHPDLLRRFGILFDDPLKPPMINT